MTVAVDVSNYTSDLTPAALTAWKDAGVALVIAQAVDPPAGFPPGKTRLQVQQCSDAGLVVDAYIWLWFDLDIGDIQRKLALLERLPIRRLWLDVEDQAAAKYDQATCERKVSEAMLACTMYATTSGDTVGIYSGRWFWTDSRYMGNSTAFSQWDLWDANYDLVADAAQGFVPYGGWDHCAVKQYQGTTNFHGISGVDLNVLSEAEAAKLTNGGEEVPDPNVDYGWQAKKDTVVQAAGELLSVSDQLLAEANRKGGPRAKEIRRLANPEVRARAEKILA